jgi:ABC-type uncharacterized transport system auxiliary subunit
MKALRASLAGCALLGALVPLAGCLKRAPADKRQFVLDVSRPQGEGGPIGRQQMLLAVRPVRVSPLYEGPGFVYRKKDGTFEQDFRNEFFSTPGYLLTEELRRWFSKAPFVKRIFEAGSLDMATHVLSSRVNALYADYSVSPPRVVLEAEFTLQKPGAAPEILLHRTYEKNTPASDTSPDALVRAWARSLEEILGELERDIGSGSP